MKSYQYRFLHTCFHSSISPGIAYLETICLLIFVATLISCGTGSDPDSAEEWPREMLSDVSVNSLTAFEGRLFAATDSGLYQTPLGNSNISWTPMGLQDKEIVDIIIFEQDEILAGIRASDFEEGENTLFKTIDGGNSWQPHMGNYGGEEEQYTWVGALTVHPKNNQQLFVRGYINVTRSVDGGRNWESIYLNWDYIGFAHFIEIDKNNTDIIWAGGSKPTLDPHLIKSTDKGDTWSHLEPVENVETDVTDIIIHPNDSDKVMVGMAGVFAPSNLICKSTDGGQTWKTVLEDIRIHTLAHSAQNPKIIYASGENEAKSLFFFRSDDFGEIWEEKVLDRKLSSVSVNDIISVMIDGKEILYLGTNKGVFSYVP